MKNKRLWAIGGGIVVVLLVALLVAPSFIDWTKYQPLAQEKLRAATGYNLSMGNLRMALLPSPRAHISDVTVTKPVQGHKEEAFLTFEDANVRLALLPLLVGKIEVASITLEKPVVTLVTYKDKADNYMPVKPSAATAEGETPAEQDGASGDSAIAVNGFRVEDGTIIMRNEETGVTRQFGVDDLTVKADTLSGPFDGDGRVTYGDAAFDVSVTTGGYRAGETLPVQFNIAEKDGRAEVKWSGVAATGEAKEFQGELGMGFSDLAGVLEDIGMPMAIPNMGGRTQLTGMVTAKPESFTLTNGNLQLGETRFKARADVTGIGTDAQSVTALFETQDLLDMDALLKAADKAVKEEKKSEGKTADMAKAGSTQPLVPADFTVPAAMKVDIQMRARGLEYRDQATEAFELRATAAEGKADARVTIDKIPGGGNIIASAATGEKGVIAGTVLASVSSLKKVLSDWLDLVDEKVFENPSMPRRIETDMGFQVSGHTAVATFKTLSLGETKLAGTASYTAAARPVVTARLTGNVLTLPAPEKKKAEEKKEDGKKAEGAPAAEKIDLEFDPPQLPFDLKFDIGLARLTKGDFVVTDVKAAGAYDGKGLTLTQGGGSVNGGAISAIGTVADLKALSGIDVQAGLKTTDLESFVQAMRGTPMQLEQKIGAFTGSVKAKGDRKKMAVDATAQARGYTLQASGTLDDPFSPEIPGTMAVRIRHADLVEAIRAFSPGFGTSGGAARPVDLSGTAKISGKVYEFADMKGTLGPSDIAGSVKADMSGAVPAITANIVSKKLDVGSLVGVNSKAPAGTSGAAAPSGAGAVSSNSGQWSREPLDTGFLKAVALDLKVDAGTLMYGTWTLTDAKGAVSMKNGALKVAPITGKIYGGTIDATLDASSGGDKQPLNIAFNADLKDIAIGPFMQALTASNTKRADGTGSVAIKIKGAGISSGALMSSLAGTVAAKTKSLIIHGMDIDKLAANIVEAFDGGWKGVLAGFATSGLSSGQTAFKDIDHTFPIENGDMPIKDFKLETTKSNAIVVTNGTVSFARWYMDLQSDVKVTQPKDVPVISMRIAGPLDAAKKSVNSAALDSLIRNKLGGKAQDLLGERLEGTKAGEIINQFVPGLFGGGSQPAPATPPAATPEPAPAATPEAAPAPAAAPEAAAPPATPEPAPAEEKSPEQQLFEGVINQLSQ